MQSLDDRTLAEQLILTDTVGFGGRVMHEGAARAPEVLPGRLPPLVMLEASGFHRWAARQRRDYAVARALATAITAANSAAVAWLAERHVREIIALRPDFVYDSPAAWANGIRGELLNADPTGYRSWLQMLRDASTASGRARPLGRGDSLSLAESFAIRLRSADIEVVRTDPVTPLVSVALTAVADTAATDSVFQISQSVEHWPAAGMIWSHTPRATVDSLIASPNFTSYLLRATVRRSLAYRIWAQRQQQLPHDEAMPLDATTMLVDAETGVQSVVELEDDEGDEVEDGLDTAVYLASLRRDAVTLLNDVEGGFVDLPTHLHVVNASPYRQDDLQSAVEMYVNYEWHELICTPVGKTRYRLPGPTLVLLGPQLSVDSVATIMKHIAQLAGEETVHALLVGHPERVTLVPPTQVQAYLPEAKAADWRRLLALPFGGAAAQGGLPKRVGDWAEGAGIAKTTTRLAPPDLFLNPVDDYDLADVRATALEGIRIGAAPGAQVVIVRDGELIYDHCFGQLAPGERIVQSTDLYDLASLTKVLSTTLAIMRLVEEDSIALDAPIARYVKGLPAATGAIKVRQLLLHASRLRRDLPIHYQIRLGKGFQPIDCRHKFCRKATAKYPVPVAKDVFFERESQSQLRAAAKNSLPEKRARYGDLNFFLLQQMVERVSGVSLDRYVDSVFYHPMGLELGYRPLAAGADEKLLARIAPTEYDVYWRRQRLRGYVHDEAAALLGGVAGHAGLFGSAREVAVVFEMLARGGTYGGRRYLQAETIETFTSSAGGAKRALGFAKLLRPFTRSSAKSELPLYGHTGFTGTSVWHDPERRLTVVFTSNRIYTSKSNIRLQKAKVRERVLDAVYRATKP